MQKKISRMKLDFFNKLILFVSNGKLFSQSLASACLSPLTGKNSGPLKERGCIRKQPVHLEAGLGDCTATREAEDFHATLSVHTSGVVVSHQPRPISVALGPA